MEMNSQEFERLQAENEELRQSLSQEREQNKILLFVAKEAKRLVTTQTRKAGVDYFRQLLKDSGLNFDYKRVPQTAIKQE